MKIISSIDHKRLQLSFYEKLIYILRYFNLFIEKKLFNFYNYIVGTIPLNMRTLSKHTAFLMLKTGFKVVLLNKIILVRCV